MRLRIQRATWPRNALILTDTPRPRCPDCDGVGGTEHDYGDYETGDLSQFKGKTIHISFTGVQSNGPPTWFLLDDVNVNVWK